MAVTYGVDYVYSDAPKNGDHRIFFIGTPNYIFVYPLSHSKVKFLESDKRFFPSINDKSPDQYFLELLDHPDTTLESLELELMSRVDDFDTKDIPRCECKKISDHKFFKVQANFMGSSLMIGNQKIGFKKLLVLPLGKFKKDIKAFYS